MNFTVVLVGAGNMGGALLRGWIAGGMQSENVTVLDPAPAQPMVEFCAANNVTINHSADGIVPPDVLMIAVKPQMMGDVLPQLISLIGADTVAVSVAAGTTIATLSDGLGGATVVRVMPNTPSLVGRGIAVGCPGSGVTDGHKLQVSQLLEATGKFEWVDEEAHIDAVTAVSGSGPAYVFHLVECMAAAGVASGLSQTLAETLARETVSGAGELLYQSADPAGQLRKNVTSPGGTTAAALEVLMESGELADLMKRAILAAKKRSEELS